MVIFFFFFFPLVPSLPCEDNAYSRYMRLQLIDSEHGFLIVII
jgi:hypothetical protein